jgi:hypothetical protein
MSTVKKTCSTCKKSKNTSKFATDRFTPDGKRCQCKDCANISRKLRYKTRGPHGSIEGRFKSVSAGCKWRGHAWELTFEQWSWLVVGKTKRCVYCKGKLPQTGSSLDRMDSAKGYLPDNVVPCCKKCNEFKSNKLNYEEMMAVMKLLKKMRKETVINPKPHKSPIVYPIFIKPELVVEKPPVCIEPIVTREYTRIERAILELPLDPVPRVEEASPIKI